MGETPGKSEIRELDGEIWSSEDDDSDLQSWLESPSTRGAGGSNAWRRIEGYWERKWLREQLDDYGLSEFALEDDDWPADTAGKSPGC